MKSPLFIPQVIDSIVSTNSILSIAVIIVSIKGR